MKARPEPMIALGRRAGMRIALMLALLLAACGGGGPVATPSPSASPFDPTGSWELGRGTADGAPIPVVAGHRITLEITGTRIGGTAACNHYGAQLVVRDGRLDLEELALTAMACVDEGVMESEAAYIAALEVVDAMGMDGPELVLRGPDVELRFVALAPPPTAQLIGTTWVLETVVVGDVAAQAVGEPATLELRDDGTLVGSTGCRSFEAEWVEQGDQILATSLTMDDRTCPRLLTEQDSYVVGVVGDGFVPAVEGDRLTLVDPGSVSLVYRREG